ncbi:hypothetical protein ACPXCE_28090 [Streptomyces sp. DT24]
MLAASPALAAPNWNPISPDSYWKCGTTTTHPAGGVLFQTCIVSRPGGNTQAVLVVKNNSGHSIQIEGSVAATALWPSNTITDHSADCVQSTLSTGYSSGCFTATANLSGSQVRAASALIVNGQLATTTQTPYVYPS